MKTISNDIITITVDDHGAEMVSIKCGGREYLWGGHPEFWKRHSPVLFPIVGSVWNGEYRSGGKVYKMGQHGIARDMDFVCTSDAADTLSYELRSSAETLAKYPYPFDLRISYRLTGRTVQVIWEVENISSDELPFQIGAHPAFYWPLLSNDTINGGVETMNAELAKSSCRGYFKLSPEQSVLTSRIITEGGCVHPTVTKAIAVEAGGYLPLDTDTFNDDALILEGGQVQRVTLCDDSKKPYLTVTFQSPLVGLWSPPHKNAPFVCIEPWYGRTDSVGYAGTFEAREHINHLPAGETFRAMYEITIE